jgi:hypothetical protein
MGTFKRDLESLLKTRLMKRKRVLIRETIKFFEVGLLKRMELVGAEEGEKEVKVRTREIEKVREIERKGERKGRKREGGFRE